jgi:hypothetical protein
VTYPSGKKKSYMDDMIGLKDALSPRWGLKGALEKKMRARRQTLKDVRARMGT